MDFKLLISPVKPSPSTSTSLPFFLSYKSSFPDKHATYPKPHLSLSVKSSYQSTFLGQNLTVSQSKLNLGNLKNSHAPFLPIRAAVKRRKELPFDNVIQRDKKLKLVMKIRKILVSQPNRIMPLRDLGRYRRLLGLQQNRRLIALLNRFPGVFEIIEKGAYSLQFKLTPEAESLYLEELKLRNEMEELLVVKLRKLLMMSLDKRILLEKIAHLKTDFGLPLEFRDTICQRYPQYFRVVATGRGPALELTHWDPDLAVSAAELAEEENRAKELEEKNLIIDRPLKFNRVQLPKGLKLSRGEMRRITQFKDMPFISPYSDFSHIKPGSAEKEKHACAVVHEILSLTVEKRTLVDHLTHFREEFRFSQQVRGMLIRHPDMFYVSLKGERDSVFLREAYRDSQLVDKDRLLLIKEKMRALVSVPRKRGAPKSNVTGEEGNDKEMDEGSEEVEWFDVDNQMDDEFEDDQIDGNYKDDWTDDDDDNDIPLDFDDDGSTEKVESGKRGKQVDDVYKNEEERLPVFPDGRPRERW